MAPRATRPTLMQVRLMLSGPMTLVGWPIVGRGLPAARIGDSCAQGGVIVMGRPTVIIN